MASEIDALLARVDDDALRQDLKTHFDRLRQKRQFGLVFEEHLPEQVALIQHPIRRGTKAVPKDDQGAKPRVVLDVADGLASLPTDDGDVEQLAATDLVAIAEFGEPVYPGLKQLGSIERGDDKPAHVVIKGENHHALEALQFTHAGKVDCIYIDPPYNTGASDWKYNNDYVDGDDAYRHSKWLAMMQRRLLLAQELLNPSDSVLIVTIDEKEYLRLGLLLEQLFPGDKHQMVSIVINPLGQARKQELARVEEYAFFVFFGKATPCRVADDLLTEANSSSRAKKVRWEWLIRGGTHSLRHERPNLFYPIFVNVEERRIVEVGDSLPEAQDRSTVEERDGLLTVWPLKADGSEGNWRCSPDYLRELLELGYARVGSYNQANNRFSFHYLGKAQIKRIGTGEVRVVGRDVNGAVVLEADAAARRVTAKTVWNRLAHRAGEHGSTLVKKLVPGREFPFPKSIYAVVDALRIAVGDRPDALVLDFFAGSGTTAHATMILNDEDGGRRRSMSVTNNAVSAEQAARFQKDGLSPGDDDWEEHGIFAHITRPRIEAAASGATLQDTPLKGEYLGGKPMSEGFEANVEFLELTYLDAEDIELDMAFTGIAPLLWMRAGNQGPIIEDSLDKTGERLPYATAETYAVLFDPDHWRPFIEDLPPAAKTVFIVTDAASVFAGIAAELPPGVEAVRLYENYLMTFTINQGGRSQ